MKEGKTPEQLAYDLFISVMKQKQEALDELAAQMKKEGKFPWEYFVCDNFDEVLQTLENENKLIPYRCWPMPRLAASTILNETEGE